MGSINFENESEYYEYLDTLRKKNKKSLYKHILIWKKLINY